MQTPITDRLTGRLRTEIGFEELVERARIRGRRSLRLRRDRVRSKAWHVGQAALAAALAWFIARDLLGHPTPTFAPVVAVVCLGMSYRQRLRRVAEVTVGVSVGVLVADLFVALAGTGVWQVALVVATAMVVALLMDASDLLVLQSAVQSIFVVTLIPDAGQSLTRWQDALVGGATAVLAAAVVPSAPLRTPRVQAGAVARVTATVLSTSPPRCSAGPGPRTCSSASCSRRPTRAWTSSPPPRGGAGTRSGCAGSASWSNRWTVPCGAPGC